MEICSEMIMCSSALQWWMYVSANANYSCYFCCRKCHVYSLNDISPWGRFWNCIYDALSQAGWRWSPCCVAVPRDHLSIKKWHNGILQLPASITIHQKINHHIFSACCPSLSEPWVVRCMQFEFFRVIYTWLYGVGPISTDAYCM